MLLSLPPFPLKLNKAYQLSVFKNRISWGMEDLGSFDCFFLFRPRVGEEHEIQIRQVFIDLTFKYGQVWKTIAKISSHFYLWILLTSL